MKICLDAGHFGKYNRSPALPDYYESEMNWQLQALLKKELEACGITVITTRSDQKKDLGLIERGKRSKGCDLFLSLHSNAVGSYVNEEVDHCVIFAPADGDKTSHTLAQKLAPVITEVMELSQKNYRIAANKASTDRNGDGKMNDDYYGVLYGARQVGTPALIIEHSFHTCTRSTRWLMDAENLAKLAKAEAEVICLHFGINQPIYRVQVGAYTVKANAEKMLQKLKSAGYGGFITEGGGYHRVQVGAYTQKKNADAMASTLKEKGFSVYVKK